MHREKKYARERLALGMYAVIDGRLQRQNHTRNTLRRNRVTPDIGSINAPPVSSVVAATSAFVKRLQ